MFFQKSFLIKSMIIASVSVAMVGCGGDSENDSKVSESNDGKAQAKGTISFTPKNLEPLGDDYDYEGWLITSKGDVIATGKFDIDANNKEATQAFEVSADYAKFASKFVLTIEPQNETGDDIAAPSKVHIIGGDITNSTATLTTSHGDAFGSDFSAASAKYILATPTNGNATPTQGIWFIDDSSGSPVAGLDLPELPAGWQYEGWIVDDGPLSTGTFLKGDQADSDGAGSATGDKTAPRFPGQDYINPAKDLVGKTAVISVEPDPDNSAAPFSIKPLVGTITNEGGVMSLENKAEGSLPSAAISIANNL